MWVSRGLCGYVATLYVGNEINVGSWGSDECRRRVDWATMNLRHGLHYTTSARESVRECGWVVVHDASPT